MRLVYDSSPTIGSLNGIASIKELEAKQGFLIRKPDTSKSRSPSRDRAHSHPWRAFSLAFLMVQFNIGHKNSGEECQ